MSYLALGDGPPSFPPDSSCPVVLRIPLATSKFRLRDSHSLWCNFPVTSPTSLYANRGPYPDVINYFGLGSFLFAHHYSGNHSFIFSSSGYLDVSVPRVPLHTLYYLRMDTIALPMVCSHIRISTDQSLFATPRSFSQLVTSFFGA